MLGALLSATYLNDLYRCYREMFICSTYKHVRLALYTKWLDSALFFSSLRYGRVYLIPCSSTQQRSSQVDAFFSYRFAFLMGLLRPLKERQYFWALGAALSNLDFFKNQLSWTRPPLNLAFVQCSYNPSRFGLSHSYIVGWTLLTRGALMCMCWSVLTCVGFCFAGYNRLQHLGLEFYKSILTGK
jgi:hypothetical protein